MMSTLNHNEFKSKFTLCPRVRPSTETKLALIISFHTFRKVPVMTTLLSPLLSGLTLDKDEYIDLLTKLIGESVHVQNNPRQGQVSVW